MIGYEIKRNHHGFSTGIVVLISTIFGPKISSFLDSEPSDSLDKDKANILKTIPDSYPCSANGHCTPL